MSARASKPPRLQGAPRAKAAPPRDRWPLALVAIFAVAFAWRLAFLSRLAGTPLDGSRLSDARSYWEWSTYLLSHGPVGAHAFFLAPLYPYVLAALRAALGDDAHRVLVAQAAWGSLAAVLLADTARRLTRPAIGIAVGLMVAFARMAVFFDALVLSESLLFALGAALLWTVARAAGRAVRDRDALLWGALCGLLAQGRATAALLVLPAAALAWAGAGTPARGVGARGAAAVAGAFALVCAPAAWRNAAVSGEWIPFTYNAGYNLYVGNHPDAQGGFAQVTGTHDITDLSVMGEDGGIEGDGRSYIREVTGRDMKPSESASWWAGRATDWMRAHPARAATLWARRVAMVWSVHESPQIENADEFALLAGPMGLPWAGSFAVLAALAFAGGALAWRRTAAAAHATLALRFAAAHAAIVTIALAPFFVTDRYRHHVVPAALLLAAYAVHELLEPRTRAAWRAWAPAAACGLALALWPVPHLTGERYAVSLAGDLGARWLESGNAEAAERELARAVALDRGGRVRWAATSEDSFQRGVLYYQHARALSALSRDGEALGALRVAAALAPGSRTIATALASALAATGDESRAAAAYAAEGRASAATDAARDRAWALARAGRYAEAETLFARLVAREPGRTDLWGALVRLQVQAGHVPAARAWLARGRAAGWSGPAYDAHESLLLFTEGRRDDARAAFARVPRGAAGLDPPTAQVVRWLEQQLAR